MLRIPMLLAAALFFAGLLAPAARAQEGASVYSTQRPGGGASPLEWIFGRRAATRPDARVLRVPQNREARPRTYEPRRRSTPVYRPAAPTPERALPATDFVGPQLPGETPQQSTPQTADAPASASGVAAPQLPPVTIAVIGDSLSIFLAQGLQEIYGEKPSVTFLKRNRESSGLVRNDYYDWPKQLRDLIATTPKIDAIALQIGSNDRQALRDDTGAHEPRSPRWNELYAKRIDEITAIAREKKIPLIWIGMPPMRGERFSADLLAINEMYKARSAAAGISFVDVWEAFSGETGGYTVNGPDVDGTIVRLRTADGVHFTRAGSRKLAWFADKELQKIVAGVQGKPSPGATISAALTNVPTPIGGILVTLPQLPEPALPPALRSTDSLLGVALPDAPLLTALRPRPEAGRIERLTAPPVSTGGLLLGAQESAAAASAEPERMGTGAPKPGRSDDFRLNR